MIKPISFKAFARPNAPENTQINLMNKEPVKNDDTAVACQPIKPLEKDEFVKTQPKEEDKKENEKKTI